MWTNAGEVLPVTSGQSSDTRQAATPTHTVSIRDITSRSIKENWLNFLAPQTRLKFRGSQHGLPSRTMQFADLSGVFPTQDFLAHIRVQKTVTHGRRRSDLSISPQDSGLKDRNHNHRGRNPSAPSRQVPST